jgi:REP element-mobilizing transposase RayT
MKAKYDPHFHRRHSMRLQGYDYSQAGMYFVTIVTQGRACLFGEIADGTMRLNRYGDIVQKWWEAIPEHFPTVGTGAFVVMPNHVHGIIVIADDRRGTVPVPQVRGEVRGEMTSPLLGQIVAYFKYQSSKEINAINGGTVTRLWQRNFYDHIIRNQQDLELTWLYIESNPARWEKDGNQP